MNPALANAEVDALLEVLHRGILRIRTSAAGRDSERAEAIADALHNVPRLVTEGHKWGWTVATFRELFLAPLVARYPDLAPLEQPLHEIDLRNGTETPAAAIEIAFVADVSRCAGIVDVVIHGVTRTQWPNQVILDGNPSGNILEHAVLVRKAEDGEKGCHWRSRRYT